MRIWELTAKFRAVSCRWIEAMLIRYELVIFYKNVAFGNAFYLELVEVFRSRVEGDVSLLVFNSWNYFFSQLGLVSREIFSILGVDV